MAGQHWSRPKFEKETEYDILKKLKKNNWIHVHNTYSDYIEFENCYYCTCPKANLYIENQLPIIQYLMISFVSVQIV